MPRIPSRSGGDRCSPQMRATHLRRTLTTLLRSNARRTAPHSRQRNHSRQGSAAVASDEISTTRPARKTAADVETRSYRAYAER